MLPKELSAIPDKLYFTIGEVATLCDLKPHVLRYWEQEFPVLNPSKRRGNRRYYQRRDVIMVRSIKDLLYNQGYTIEGARQQLSGESSGSKKEVGGTAKVHQHQDAIHKAVVGLQEVIRELEAE